MLLFSAAQPKGGIAVNKRVFLLMASTILSVAGSCLTSTLMTTLPPVALMTGFALITMVLSIAVIALLKDHNTED